MKHEWTLEVGARPDAVPLLVAVCIACGLIRTSQVPVPAYERHIYLGGECPGEPQRQEKSGARREDLES